MCARIDFGVIPTHHLKISTQRSWNHGKMQSKFLDYFLPIFTVMSQLHRQPEDHQQNEICLIASDLKQEQGT